MSNTRTAVETELRISWMDSQRRHAVEILDELSDEDLRRPIVASGWSCLGMIGHLAGMERFWYRKIVMGEPDAASDLGVSIEWQVPADISPQRVFASYRHEIEMANAIVRATPLETAPRWWPDFFDDFQLGTLREIVLHTMTETAAHAGHLDSARERIDGRQWLVLEE